MFDRRTRAYDHEHGHAGRIPVGHIASFYAGPVNVLVIARCKLRGECGWTDDAYAPGLDVEIRHALAAYSR